MIIEVPTPTPVTIPDVPIVAMAILLLVHIPPAEVSDKVEIDPTQILVEPVMGPTAKTEQEIRRKKRNK